MRAEVKDVLAPDVDHSPMGSVQLAQLLVGSAGQFGAESFQTVVVTVDEVAQRLVDGPVVGRWLVIVERLEELEDFERAVDVLRVCVGSTTGESWDEVSDSLRSIGQWEFEDYVEDPSVPQVVVSGAAAVTGMDVISRRGELSMVVRLKVGEVGGVGELVIDVMVVTLDCLAVLARRGPVVGRWLLVVDSIDADGVESVLSALVAELTGVWSQVAIKLRQLGKCQHEPTAEFPTLD